MPGPKSNPQPIETYRDDVLALRRKARPNRKRANRLDSRIVDFENFTRGGRFPDGAVTKPGSQNRNK